MAKNFVDPETTNDESMMNIDFPPDSELNFRTLENDSEVELRIKDYETKPSKAGKPMIHAVLEVPNDPDFDDIHHYLMVPTDEIKEEDPKRAKKMYIRIQQFYKCIGLSTTRPFGKQDVIGLTGRFIVGAELDEQSGLTRNTIKSCIERR
jgi:hypothetical protein